MRYKTKPDSRRSACFALITVLLAFSACTTAHAAPAAFPRANEVVLGQALPIDGEYRISTLNKRILIERGRAVVLEGWRHLFLFTVEPGMVVIKDIRQVDGQNYQGYDFGLNAEWRAQHNPSKGSYNVVVKGPLGDYRYELLPVNADDQSGGGYEDPEPVVMQVRANRMGNAEIFKLRSCPGRNNYLSRGSCWVCPDAYKRAKVTREMHQPDACIKKGSWGKGPFRPAKISKGANKRCPAGQFHVAESGVNGCYACPTGYTRDRSARNSTMCTAL